MNTDGQDNGTGLYKSRNKWLSTLCFPDGLVWAGLVQFIVNMDTFSPAYNQNYIPFLLKFIIEATQRHTENTMQNTHAHTNKHIHTHTLGFSYLINSLSSLFTVDTVNEPNFSRFTNAVWFYVIYVTSFMSKHNFVIFSSIVVV